MRSLASLLVIAACSSEPATELPCDVAGVLCARCVTCHTDPPVSGAHFPLLTWANTHAQFGTTNLEIWQRMQMVIEANAIPHMPPTTSPTGQPTPAELDTLRAWFAAGAPSAHGGAGCDHCVGVPDAGVGP